MPDPNEYESQDDFMAACVPKRMEEGDTNEQAVGACMGIWKEKKSIDPSNVTVSMPDGEIKTGRVLAQRNIDRITQAVNTLKEALSDAGISLDPVPEGVPTSEPFLDNKSLTDVSVYFGGAVKSLGDGRVGGYLVRYSTEQDPDISDARDFFTKSTDFVTTFPRQSPAWFNHALDIKKKRLSHDATLSQDDFGVWAETILDERDQYEKFLLSLSSEGKLGWSSGTASHLVERAPVGQANKVLVWPLGLDASLTHMPAEPRNEVIPLKSLSDLLPPIPEPEPEGAPEAGDNPAVSEGEEPGAIKSNPVEDIMELTEEKLTELVQASAKAAAEEALKSLPAKPEVRVITDEADKPFANDGEFFKAVKMAGIYPSQEDPRLRPLKAATGMSEGVPADGGYLVQPETAAGIFSRMYGVGSILGLCANDPVSGNSMLYNGVDESSHASTMYGGLVGYWLGEAGTITATKPKFYQLNLKLKKIAALCYATDEQLEDTPALQGWLTRTVPDVLRWFVEEAIVQGDGVGKPLGIMNSPCLITQDRDTASHIYLADIANMWSRRWTGVNDYVWLIGADGVAQLNQMTASTAPVYMPPSGMNVAPYGTLYGRPVVETEHMQALNTSGDIILASLSQYQTITKAGSGISSASSIHVSFATAETAFRFIFRVDGAPLWNSALTPAHGSNTVGPFVCLKSAS